MALTSWSSGSGGWTARLAALLFLVHAALLGFSLGSAEAMPRDRFGNVICVSGTAADTDQAPGAPDHGAVLAKCCQLGCALSGGPAAPPPSLASLPIRRPLALTVPFVLVEDVGSGAVETPRRTRGPPLSV